MGALDIKEDASDVLTESVKAVCESEKNRVSSAKIQPKKIVIQPNKSEIQPKKSEIQPKKSETSVKNKIKIEKVRPRKRKLAPYTWYKRSHAIFMFLHKKIFNRNAYRASDKLGIPRSTLLTWTSCSVKKNCVNKWFDLISNLTWADVKRSCSKEIAGEFDFLNDDERVDVSSYSDLRGKTVVLSKFSGVASAKRAKLAKVCKQAKARGEESKIGDYILIKKNTRRLCKPRPPKFATINNKMKDFIVQSSYSGTPCSRAVCYMMAMEFCEDKGEFWEQYLDPEKTSAQTQLSHWLTRVLKSIGFTSRKETVSQSVPDN